MENYGLVTIILGVSALASVFNARVLKLPNTIGLMATGLLGSFVFLIFGSIFPSAIADVCHLSGVADLDFSSFVFDLALGFSIFGQGMTISPMVKKLMPQ
ncbi:MAG: CPA1 family monovalent cation:H+ antiporter [Verrucomicrobiales bacterium]|jgi:CPA1 family monovalent cation:H+ antiporter